MSSRPKTDCAISAAISTISGIFNVPIVIVVVSVVVAGDESGGVGGGG